MNTRFRSTMALVLVAMASLATANSARAELFGGIEIGAKGIRAITVDLPAQGGDSKVAVIDNKNATLVANLAETKEFAAQPLAETADIVGKAVQRFRDEFKIPEGRIFIAGSSGLFVPLASDAGAIDANKAKLAQAIKAKTGLPIEFISIEREADLTIVSVIPISARKDSILIDIGSGNTKGGLVTDDRQTLNFGVPFGTITFYDRVKKAGGPLETAAAQLRADFLEPELAKAISGKPDLVRRPKVYLAGGTAWAMTTYLRPADRSEFVPLKGSDIATFSKLVADNTKELPAPEISKASESDQKAAQKDIDAVKKVFTRDQLVAGASILCALSKTFQLDDPNRQIYFPRNGNIGWIHGYTLEQALKAAH